MATLFKHANLCKIEGLNLKFSPLLMVIRNTVIPPKKKQKKGTIKHRHLIKSVNDSLAAKGFLRACKPYQPPSDITERLDKVYRNVLGSNFDKNLALTDSKTKFDVLNACFKEFNHSVPSSQLITIDCIEDVTNFYNTEVSTTTPYDKMRSMDLPPNLHVQYDYLRFNPETDTMFKGISAFNESSTIVTGLKYKEKYKGHVAKFPDYYDNWADFIKEVEKH